MNVLAINTASSFTAIALLEEADGQIKIVSEESWTSKNDEAEKLMPAISQLLTEQNLSFTDLGKIVVVRGPGSFTGLRIGVSVANTLAYLLKVELLSITTFDFWHQVTDLPILVFAGKGGVYFSEKDDSKGELINLTDLDKVLKQRNINTYFGDISPEQKEQIEAKFEDQDFSFAQGIKSALVKVDSQSVLKKDQIVTPFYIKKPSITKSNKPLCFT